MRERGGRLYSTRRVAGLLLVFALAGCERPASLVTRPAGSPRSTLIRSVAIFDGHARARDADVLLEDGRIWTVAPAGTLPAVGRAVIEGRGLTLLPGLIDLHGHTGSNSEPIWRGTLPVPERNLESYLYAGVTTVLDPADLAPAVFERRAAVAEGKLLGPRIFAAGPIFTTPRGHPVTAYRELVPWWLRWYVLPRAVREVATPGEARRAVTVLAASQPDVIKVAVDAIPLGSPVVGSEVLWALVDEARAHGIRTVAHVGSVADALAAADAGVAAWMHGVYKERIPDELVPRFVAAHIPMVATMVVFESHADMVDGRRESTALERETVAPEVLTSFTPVPAGGVPAEFESYFRQLPTTREARCDNVRRLHAAGVTILAGADTQSGVFPGPGLHRELAHLVRCGLTPVEALRAATGDAARFVTASDDPEFGVVAEGKLADLVLVEGDPTTNIAHTERIRTVFKAGVPLERHPIGTAGGVATSRVTDR